MVACGAETSIFFTTKTPSAQCALTFPTDKTAILAADGSCSDPFLCFPERESVLFANYS